MLIYQKGSNCKLLLCMATKTKLKKLHLGCGTIAPSDWINIDSSWNAWLAKHPLLKYSIKMTGMIKGDLLDIPWPKNILLHDITKNLPFKDNSIDYIYSSHSLEHLYLEQAKILLKECFRVLKPEGIFRIIVPDLKAFVKKYLTDTHKESDPEGTKADRLLILLRLQQPNPNSKNLIVRCYNRLNNTDSHKWMYDTKSLTFYLKRAGFTNVKTRKLFESKINDIKTIEQPIRLDDAVCLETEKSI